MYIEKAMIDPKNTRLINFRFVVTIAWYMDFGMTSLIISNYWFQMGDEKYDEFIHHREMFAYV